MVPSGLTLGFMTGRSFKNRRRRVVQLFDKQMHESSRKTKLTSSFWYSIGKTTLRACPALIEYLGSPLDRLQAYPYVYRTPERHSRSVLRYI